MNPLGCIKTTTTRVVLPLYHEIPKIGLWNDDFNWRGKDTRVRFEKILNVSWDSKKGKINFDVEISYFENDFADDYEEPKEISKLKLIKGGAD
jgi:hypothetical protein